MSVIFLPGIILLYMRFNVRMSAARQYNQLVEGSEFEVCGRVMICHPPTDNEMGRKLTLRWRGPHRVNEVLTSIFDMVRAKFGREVGRVHVFRFNSFYESIC